MTPPLTPAERAVLAALQSLGAAESWAVAREAGLDHPEAHAALQTLARRGLARERVIVLGWAVTQTGRLVDAKAPP